MWLVANESDTENDSQYSETAADDIPQPLRLLSVFLLMWQYLYHVSDAGISILIVFLHHFFRLLSSLIQSDVMTQIAAACPTSLHNTRKILGFHGNQFQQFVVCPKCNSVYEFDQCIGQTARGQKYSKRCWYVPFPNHTRRQQRTECGTPLLNTVQSRSRATYFRPIKVFCYQSLKKSIALLFQQEHFVKSIQLWRERRVPEDIMGDVYDGKLWHTFSDNNGKRFTDEPYNLMVFLNVDWFQPFTHVTYSVGAMYLSIQNLPRSMRYKLENVILIGIIPGPKEPKYTMNQYLSHLVEELKDFWYGVEIPLQNTGSVIVKLALTGISCDLPAVRKVCGFAGFSSILGCSKCLHHFQSGSFGQKLDYSGYNRQLWPLRTLTAHKEAATQYTMAKTPTEQKRILSKFGVRYSSLIDLPYFNPIRFHVVDPMHNLLLGTAKHMMQIWTKHGILSYQSFVTIEERVRSITTPKDIGRLPQKISFSFSGFTADQWKNWTTIFSIVCLKGILPQDHLNCWILFTKACNLLCSRVIHKNALVSADLFLQQFCKKFEELYGKEDCTPNMHMHLHIKESVVDYGPVYGFWCFAFERLNGVLGSYQTNNKQIEPQIMSKFISERTVRNIPVPIEYKPFLELLPNAEKGTLHNATCSGEGVMRLAKLSSPNLPSTLDFSISEEEKLIGPYSESVLSSDLHQQICIVYQQLYSGMKLHFVPRTYMHSRRAALGGELLVAESFNKKHSVIASYWPGFGESIDQLDPAMKRIGTITFFLKHTVTLERESNGESLRVEKNHIFCRVKWHQYHSQPLHFGSSAIACTRQTEVESACCYLPLKRVANRCAFGDIAVNFGDPLGIDSTFVAIPLPFSFNV